MKKRLIILALAVLLTAGFTLTACLGGGNTGDLPSTSDTASGENDTGEVFPLVLNGIAAYKVVRPSDSKSDDPDVAAAIKIKKELDTITGLTFGLSDDWREPSEGVREILVGQTKRPSSAAAYAALAYDEYSVSLVNGDIVVAGWTESALSRAASMLIQALRAGSADGAALSIDSGIENKGRDGMMPQMPLPALEGATLTGIYACSGTQAHVLNFNKADTGAFTAYTEKLLAAGGKTVQTFSNADGDYTVISNGSFRYTISNWKNTKEISMVIEKEDSDFCLTPGEFTPVTEPKVISPGYEVAGMKKGMCYIMQASDGSYVIIDGSDEDAIFSKRIYDILMKYKPANVVKPHIRAWFLTHQHADHMTGIVEFASNYGSRVTCDAVFTNMVPKKYQTAYDNYESRYNRMITAASKFGGDFVIFRTGQTYYFADIEVFMLATADDMLPTVFSSMDDTSPIMRCNVAGTVCLFSGDAGYAVFTDPVKRYTAATLDAVFCQASSHGQNGSAPVKYYSSASPSYYLWPATKSFYDGKTPEAYIISDSKAVIDFAFNGTKVYTIGKSGITVSAE